MNFSKFFSKKTKQVIFLGTIGGLFVLSGAFFLVKTVEANTSPFSFTKTLQVGSSGAEVLLLKYVLGLNVDTKVDQSENPVFFGPLTRQKVVIFQEKYQNEVLLPVGLTKGTGVVGVMTRKKLNELLSGSLSTQNLSTQQVQNSNNSSTTTLLSNNIQSMSLLSAQKVELLRADRTQVAPGSPITLEGRGFSGENNTILFGETKIYGQKSLNLSQITFMVPSLITPGEYVVTVINSEGKRSGAYPVVRVVVINNPLSPPEITSISPSVSPHNGTLTIFGKNFTENNTVVTGFGTVTNLPSAGGIITLDLTKLANLALVAANPKLKGVSIPMWMYVQNANGTTFNQATFTIKIN